ncbi:MAG: Gfo/Idh/MocA family oxidoreductase [Phycisphaerales bacterium]|nr:Gfo/Idh/MocA family oxidoreductase [Phycisphaerales bacterium]
MAKPLRVGLIGSRFMGKAHSNAWMSAGCFFELPRDIVMSTICARDRKATAQFAQRWGWTNWTADWRELMDDPAIDLVDVATPNHVHAEQAVAALEAGKHVACEKPLAATLADARQMRDAAAKAKRRGAMTFVWFNYRRCPAVAFAHQLVRKGRLGRIFHVRASYLQDWGGPSTPLLWRFDAKQAGSGAHGDLNAHIVDLARFLTGEEVVEVAGAIEHTFIKERPLPAGEGTLKGKGARRKGRSTVDDCVIFLARMGGGAVASFEATRLATGNQNRNRIEVNGEKGAFVFDFERMNELLWWDNTLPSAERGWSRIMCTNGGDHPYADAYWPPAHLLGYEHGFVSEAADIVKAVAGRKPVCPLPDFEDAYRTQVVLEAAIVSARERRPVAIKEIG